MKSRIVKKRILKSVAAFFAVLSVAFLILIIVTAAMFSPAYLGRVLFHWDSDVADYKFFPHRIIEKSETPYVYRIEHRASLDNMEVEYVNGGKRIRKTLADFADDSKTMSLVIVKGDAVIYERYCNGYDEKSINTSFSMAKSVVSLLVGRALEENLIESVKQPVSDFIEELANSPVGANTIEQLLSMRSNIRYEENKFLWFGDDSLTYWHPDLRSVALTRTETTEAYRGKFHYNNFNPLLLGIVLEKCTGMSVSEYFESRFWRNIGAENDASWSLDSEKSGFEKMESGINFRALDFIKLGSMMLRNGNWNGKDIIGSDWIKESIESAYPLKDADYEGTFLQDKGVGYGYMWYSLPSANGGYDFFAWGKSDQILYISPANDTVVLRTGKSDGGVANWPEAIKYIVEKVS